MVSQGQRKKSLTTILAVAISRLFDPAWLISGMLIVAVVFSVMNGLRWRFIVILTFIDGFIPFLYFVHLLRSKEISDWDTTEQKERFQLYGFTTVVHAAGVLLAWLIGKTVLAKILLAFWILALVFFLITFVWKISLHAGVLSSAITFLVLLDGWKWAWLYGLLLGVGWARVAMRKHTLAQVVVGAVLSSALLVGLFEVLGLTQELVRAPSERIIELF